MSDTAYASIATHRWMIQDKIRTEAFRQAIIKTVRPGDIVVEVGAGTGILSVFAALAGADRVYAIERAPISDVIIELAEANDVADKIVVCPEDVRRADIPEPCDLIISEWMGCFGVDEGMLPSVLTARDRWLQTDRMLPASVACMASPISDPKLNQDKKWWASNPFGINLSPIEKRIYADYDLFYAALNANNLLADPSVLWQHQCARVPIGSIEQYRGDITFTVVQNGSLDGFAVWFKAVLAEGIDLENGPQNPKTHWGQAVLPVNVDCHVNPGDTVHLSVECAMNDKEKPLSWCWQINDGAQERRGHFS